MTKCTSLQRYVEDVLPSVGLLNRSKWAEMDWKTEHGRAKPHILWLHALTEARHIITLCLRLKAGYDLSKLACSKSISHRPVRSVRGESQTMVVANLLKAWCIVDCAQGIEQGKKEYMICHIYRCFLGKSTAKVRQGKKGLLCNQIRRNKSGLLAPLLLCVRMPQLCSAGKHHLRVFCHKFQNKRTQRCSSLVLASTTANTAEIVVLSPWSVSCSIGCHLGGRNRRTK